MADRETVTHRGSGDESGGEAARPPEGNPGRMADPLPPPSIGGEPIDWAERGLDSALPIGSAEPSGIGTLEGEAPVFGAGSVSGGRGRGRIGDRVFAALASGSGLFIVVLIVLVASSWCSARYRRSPMTRSNFLISREWSVEGATLRFGVLDLLWVTVLISLIAMVIAVPIAIGIALFITQYAPARLARPVAYVIDLLAAIPSIIYGIWGIAVLAPEARAGAATRSTTSAWSRCSQDKNVEQRHGLQRRRRARDDDPADHHRDQPRRLRAHAAAEHRGGLGARRDPVGDDPDGGAALRPAGRRSAARCSAWAGRSARRSRSSLILSKVGRGSPFTFSIFNGGETFASKIANNAAEFNNPTQTGAYIAAGLVLFVLTFVVNAAARGVVNRRKEFA